MSIGIMRCPKCGFTQKSSSSCKSCGTAIEGQPEGQPRNESPPPPEPVFQETPAASVVKETQTKSVAQEAPPGPFPG